MTEEEPGRLERHINSAEYWLNQADLYVFPDPIRTECLQLAAIHASLTQALAGSAQQPPKGEPAMTAEAPAETMRRAAKKMRAAAKEATDDDQETVVDGLLNSDDAAHIGSWGPDVALAVADLLDAAARDADLGLDWTELHGAALDVAHVYLGEHDRTYFEAPASE